ncbi:MULTISPECIES: methyl-accepting chemotaxis protein [unclassified Oceanispirochaeta]|uniref:methyl-accepting chemotaxis protein n=1 Tax=unclassified Oceanispirochaeta TaxID=2635722 RepID=UPI000E093533|nr:MULTISPECIES: methyl-accepting chemotaxis protein [unclassified Oceanispirochaeta]MBF9014670.1 methyl-accepting chemotaxis protein [Oceanispirochaeta sp. M2]NPD70926.1 methyl-accepting chemotaxis protein [Oceanispirochaeta sp. M1]RDG33760.1 methyl-accepting chemotaxis protein [Oceanispirochaeta sp. M1]
MKKKYFSMKYSMSISFSLLAVLLISAFGTLTYIQEQQRLHDSIYETMKLNTELIAESIDSWMQLRLAALEAKRAFMEQEGTINLVRQGGYSNNIYLKGDEGRYGVDVFYLGLPDDSFLYGEEWTTPDDYKATKRPWYKAAAEKKDTIITDYYTDAITGEQNITVAAPIYSITGKLIGVLGMDLYLSDLLQVLEAHHKEGTNSALMDERGIIVVHSDAEMVGTNALEMKDDNGKAFMESVMNSYDGNQDFTLNNAKRTVFYDDIPSISWKTVIMVSEKLIYGPLKALKLQIILFILVALLINAPLVYFVSSLFAKRISNVSESLQEISEGDGDLTKSIKVVRNDELSLLTENFNNFTTLIRNMISGIKTTADSTMETKDQLLVNTEETAAAINEISANMHSIETQIQRLDKSIGNSSSSVVSIDSSVSGFDSIREEQAAIVEETSASIVQMMNSLKQVASISQEKKAAAGQLTETSRKGSTQLENLSSSFNENVVSRLTAIEDMTKVIRGISNQINLLSMNAAIEAAHAGDSGRGFAVVADEIRKLAESSSSSVKIIDSSVKEIRNGVDDTVKNTKETAAIFVEMNTVVDDFVDALNQIASNTDELMAGSQEIGSTSRRLNEITISIKDSADVMKSETADLSKEMETIQNVSKTVLSGIQEAVIGSNEIVQAMDMVKELSNDLASNSEDLKNEIDRFKTEE